MREYMDMLIPSEMLFLPIPINMKYSVTLKHYHDVTILLLNSALF